MKRYLFSAIGKTDPIKNNRDGAILHIIRNYKPDCICLYMTKEIMEYQEKDIASNGGIDRYTYSFGEMIKKIGKKIEICYEKDYEMSNPHKYNVFYKKFSEMINDIEKKAKDDCGDDYEILLNVSSGTPAQKDTLQLIATLGNEHYKAIQVSKPEAIPDNEGNNGGIETELPKPVGKTPDNEENYGDIKTKWEKNLDNNKDKYENRCSESNAEDFIGLAVIKENVKLLINSYDYSSAYELLGSIKCDNHLKEMVCAAMNRLEINLNKFNKNFTDEEKKIFMVDIQDENDRKSIEYLLTLNIRIKKGQYIDFARGITPIGYYLIDKLYSLRYDSELQKISTFEDRDGRKIRMINTKVLKKESEFQELNKFLKNEYNDEVKRSPFYFDTYYRLIKYHFSYKQDVDRNLYEIVEKLATVESEVRNLVAHQIEYMSEERMKEIAKLYPEEIYEKLIQLAKECKITLNIDVLDSYEKMNSYIIDYIDNNFHKSSKS